MNSKALRLGLPGLVAPFELAEIMVESEGLCAYCGIELDPLAGTFDHVLSFAQGGPNRKDNIVRACHQCNRTKAATKTPEQLAEYSALRVTCACGVVFRPRWADWIRGLGKFHSRACSGRAGGRR